MSSAIKPTGPTKITDVVHTLLDGLHTMSKSETVIGEPYVLGDATLVPVHRLRVALGAGAVSGAAKREVASGESGGLGVGGAVQLEPVAVLAVGRDGIPKIMCVEAEAGIVDRLVEELPELLGNTAKLFAERIAPAIGKVVSGARGSTE